MINMHNFLILNVTKLKSNPTKMLKSATLQSCSGLPRNEDSIQILAIVEVR